MSEVAGLGLASPSSDKQADGAGALGGQLQSARNHHRQPDGFRDDRAEPPKAQGLFAGFKDIFLTDRFDIDDTIRMKADLGQRWGEEIGTGETPDNFALRPSSYPSCKHGRSGSIDSPGSATGKFVDRPIRQAAAWKQLVDFANTKWQNRFRTGHRSFEMLYAISQIGNDRVRASLRHSELSSNWFSSHSKASMFSICSFQQCESMCIYWRVLG